MAYTNKDWKKVFSFIYYKLTMLLKECFSMVSRAKINPYKGVWASETTVTHTRSKKRGDVSCVFSLDKESASKR